MRLKSKKKKIRKAGKLRRGQVVTTFACGSIVDLPGDSVVIAGTDYWKHSEDDDYRLSEPNLQQLLGIDYFVMPPGADEDTYTKYGIPAFRFPRWMYCPGCKRLAHEKKFNFLNSPKCNVCKNKRLVPSRFVIACENGHMDDFPYEWWVHHGSICQRPELFISMSKRSSGLDSIVIKCKTCDKSRSMAGSFAKESLASFRCSARRPWLKDSDPSGCEQRMRTLQRGATNLHFSVNISALTIPPWSERVQDELNNNWKTLRTLVDKKDTFITVVTSLGLPEKCGYSAEEIWIMAEKKYRDVDQASCTSWQELLEGEYRAFIQGCNDEKGHFHTRIEPVSTFLAEDVEQVTLALRLREIMALMGFKRIDPDYSINEEKSFCRLGSQYTNWLPAVELKGEGIFIRLNETAVKEWESRTEIENRYTRIMNAKNYMEAKGGKVSPRYILLHTLSHLLIRELILQCGYSSAAIKERIYCTFPGDSESLDMAGILIYTAANDSEGSLGGLVRMGETNRLENVFRQMLETASWCSADPLCIQSTGQGSDALNIAACHSCTLLPETSCEARNCYLDRASVVGTIDNRQIGFFGNHFKKGDS